MPKIETWEKKIAWIISTILGITICITAVLLLWGNPLFDEYLLLALAITVFPPAVLDYADYRWKRSIDKHLPDLFRSIVQAQKTGMTLPQALEEVSKRQYGPMTKELKKMVDQMSWGVPFEDALKSLDKRVDTALMKQTIPNDMDGKILTEIFSDAYLKKNPIKYKKIKEEEYASSYTSFSEEDMRP